MRNKNDMKIKRKIGTVIVLGIFIFLMLAQPVAAMDYPTGSSGGYVGISDTEGRIYFDNQATDEIEMLDAVVGIGDTSPDFKLEVTGSSGSGYFGVTSSSYGDRFIIDTNGRVGIGTATPGSALEIKTSYYTSATSALHVKNSQDMSLFFVQDDGNIGIGVTNPAAKLEISGNILFNFGSARSISVETCPTPNAAGNQLTVEAGNAVGGGVAGFDGGNLYLRSGDGAGTGIGGGDGGDVYIYGGDKAQHTSRSEGDVILAHTGSVARGKVGIGQTIPLSILHLRDDDPGIIFEPKTSTGDTDFWIAVNEDASNNDNDKFQIGDGTTVLTNPFVTIDTSGNVGIGTTGPNDELEVVGDSSADRFVARSGAGDVEFADEDGTDGVKISNSDSNPNILIGDYSVSSQNFRGIYLDGAIQTTSIGTIDSSSRLVVASIDNEDDTIRLLGPDGGATAWGARLNFGDGDNVYIEEDENNKLYLYGSSRTAIMGGNVGIGESTPLTKLYVDGDVAFGTTESPIEISEEEITVTHSFHVVAEGASSDEIDGIIGGDVAGQILILTADSGDDITVNDGLNIRLAGDNDFTMSYGDTITFIFDGVYWLEISRSDN